METMTDTPRIYVASLSDYNAGTLHGRWIDADQSADDIMAEVEEMLSESPEAKRFPQGGPAEEWAIHDHEGFGGWSPSESESFETVAEIAEAITQHHVGPGPVAAYIADRGEWDAEGFEEDYAGEWNSEQDFAEELADDLGYVKQLGDSALANYIDWEAWTRDLFMGDYWSADGPGVVYVFRRS